MLNSVTSFGPSVSAAVTRSQFLPVLGLCSERPLLKQNNLADSCILIITLLIFVKCENTQ